MRCSLKVGIDLSRISKLLFLLYMVYSNVTSYSLFFIKGLSFVLLFGALIFQLLNDHFRMRVDNTFTALLLFTLYIFLSGLLVAYSYDRVISTAMTFIESLLVFYLVLCYIMKDGKPDFPMLVFIIQSLVAAYLTINNGTGTKRVSISEDVNVNTVGVMLALAIGFVMFLLIAEKNKPIKVAASVAAILVLLFGIMLTVSKKAIISSAVFIILWIVFCYKHTFAKINKYVRILILGLLALGGVYVIVWYTTNYSYQFQIVQNRMSQIYTGDSDQVRIQLIKEGFSIFFSHPLFGVGFNNVRYHTPFNTYTHCFYAELPACTGIIGTLLFSYALFRPPVVLVRARRNSARGSLERTKIIYMLVLFIVLLALCVAQILFYTPNLMFVFSIVTGYAGLKQISE